MCLSLAPIHFIHSFLIFFLHASASSSQPSLCFSFARSILRDDLHCCFLALLWVCALLPAASAYWSNECADPHFLPAWHEAWCCPPGGFFMFELDPPGRSSPGPRCTLCPIGTHFSCEDGDCCATGTFCIRVDGQPRCSTTNVPSLFDAAPNAAPTGLLTNRTRSDVALDRHPGARQWLSDESSSPRLWIPSSACLSLPWSRRSPASCVRDVARTTTISGAVAKTEPDGPKLAQRRGLPCGPQPQTQHRTPVWRAVRVPLVRV